VALLPARPVKIGGVPPPPTTLPFDIRPVASHMWHKLYKANVPACTFAATIAVSNIPSST
jgi:hypothetical protein